MNLRFSRHAEGRMVRDAITAAEIEEALQHSTHQARPCGPNRMLARRVHAHTVLSVLYEQHASGPLVVSCWMARR